MRPDEVHRELEARAARRGQSLSGYALGELRKVTERPTHEELVERIRQREAVDPTIDAAALIRAERDAR